MTQPRSDQWRYLPTQRIFSIFAVGKTIRALRNLKTDTTGVIVEVSSDRSFVNRSEQHLTVTFRKDVTSIGEVNGFKAKFEFIPTKVPFFYNIRISSHFSSVGHKIADAEHPKHKFPTKVSSSLRNNLLGVRFI